MDSFLKHAFFKDAKDLIEFDDYDILVELIGGEEVWLRR